MDLANLEFLMFQRQQLQYNVFDPLKHIKSAIGRSIQPHQVDVIKSLLNREVRNFALAEVYDGEHLIDVFDLCYGRDNLKFIERLLNEANLQNIAEMVRDWKSRNKSLVPNVFYQYGFFPLWIRVGYIFIDFLKQRHDIFNTLRGAFGVPETDPASDPLIFMGLSLGMRDTLVCVLVPHSLRHHIKTSLRSNEITADLKSVHINGIYFSRVNKRASREQVTGSQLSISSACESMTSSDIGELYDAAYEDMTDEYRIETLQEQQLNSQNLQQQDLGKPKLDENRNINNGYHSDGYPDHHGNSHKFGSKPQLVRISSDYVKQEPVNTKALHPKRDENENIIEGYNDNQSNFYGNKESKPMLVQISSGYVKQNHSNKVAKVNDKSSYGKCFFVDYRSSVQERAKPNPSLYEINSAPAPRRYDENDYAAPSRDDQDDAVFSQRSVITFDEPSMLDSDNKNKSSDWNELDEDRRTNKESPWYNQELEDEYFATKAPEHFCTNNDRQQTHGNAKPRGYESHRGYYHGNNQNADYYDDSDNVRTDYHGNKKRYSPYGYYDDREEGHITNGKDGNSCSFESEDQRKQSHSENNQGYEGNDEIYHGYNMDYHGNIQSSHEDNFPNNKNVSSYHGNDKRWYESEAYYDAYDYPSNLNSYKKYEYHGHDQDQRNEYHSNKEGCSYDNDQSRYDDDYNHQYKKYDYQDFEQDQPNGYHDNKVYRNHAMLPEPEPESARSSLPYQPSSSSLTSDLVRRSTPNSSASGFSTHEMSYKSRDGNVSRSMPILFPREPERESSSKQEVRREFKSKYESQADLDDNVFVNTAHDKKFNSLSHSYSAPPNYQEAVLKKSFLSLSSYDVDMSCKKVKSPLLSSQSVSCIYREKEQLLNREELQESIRSAEIKEWEKLLDKTKEFLKAAKLGDEDEVQFLLNEGVDADYMNEFGHTALMIACREGHVAVVDVLIIYSADVNIQDKYGKSALHEAAWSGQHRVIHPLVSKGADIDIMDEEGRTPLQFAALRGKTKVAEILLFLGADSSIANKDGETAVELAFKCRHKDIVKLLLDSSDKEMRKSMQSQIRKLKIQRLKSATSLPNLTKIDRPKDRQSRARPEMRRQRSCATQ